MYWNGESWEINRTEDQHALPDEFVAQGWEYLCTPSDAIDLTHVEIDRLRAQDASREEIDRVVHDVDWAILECAAKNRRANFTVVE
jgi:hypothetical protein